MLLNTADAIYRGTTPVDRVYRGSTLVWEPPSDGPLVSDSFDRPDGLIGTADTGQTWVAHAGDWRVLSNEARVANTVESTATVDTSVSDMDVTADITIASGNVAPGLVARAIDHGNYIGAFYRPSLSAVHLFKKVGGTFTLLGSHSTSIAVGVPHATRLRVVGTTLEVYLNRVLVITATDSALQTQTRAGMRATASAEDRFDNFQVVAA